MFRLVTRDTVVEGTVAAQCWEQQKLVVLMNRRISAWKGASTFAAKYPTAVSSRTTLEVGPWRTCANSPESRQQRALSSLLTLWHREDATEEACSASCRIFSGCKRPSRTQCQTPPVMIYSASTTTTTATATQTTTATIATTTTTNNTTTTLTTTITTSTTTATTAATTTATLTITTTIPPRVVLSVEAGEQFSCRIKASDSTVYCWGREGLRTQPPLRVAFFHISLGSKFGCGLRLSDRKPQCWGENPPSVPAAAPALTTISSGGAQHACGITDNQTVFCWGNTAPIPANAVDMQFAFIAASRDPNSNAVCGIPVDEDVPVQCWGSPRPTVPNSTSFSSIGLGEGFAAAVNKDTQKVEYFGFGDCQFVFGENVGPVPLQDRNDGEGSWVCTGNDTYSFVDDLLGLFPPTTGRGTTATESLSVGRYGACAGQRFPVGEGKMFPRCWGLVDFNIPNNESATPASRPMRFRDF